MRVVLDSDPSDAEEFFYLHYNPDHWLTRLALLRAGHDRLEEFRKLVPDDLPEVDQETMKRVLRAEVHFMYFQMVETLFELVFAAQRGDPRDLWRVLTLAPFRRNFERIRRWAEGKEAEIPLLGPVRVEQGNRTWVMPLVQYAFYFLCGFEDDPARMKASLPNIVAMMRHFAKDFSDRDEYNAYKHAMRFTHGSFRLNAGGAVSEELSEQTRGVDTIACIRKSNIEKAASDEHCLTVSFKPFDYERDCRCCQIIYSLIRNFVDSRRHVLVERLRKPEVDLTVYDTPGYPEAVVPRLGFTWLDAIVSTRRKFRRTGGRNPGGTAERIPGTQ